MSLHQTEAIVLKTTDFLEYDKLVTLYTQKLGKVRAVVKGARKPTSKLAASLGLFTHLKVTLFGKRPRELYRLTQAENISFHHRLREDMVELAYGSLFIELLNRATGENEPESELFDLCIQYLNGSDPSHNLGDPSPRLCEGSYTLVYLIKLLQFVGFAPYLTGCVVCKKSISRQKKEQTVWFSRKKGGLLCSQCQGKRVRHAWSLEPISVGCIQFYQQGLLQPVALATQLKIDRKQGEMLFNLLLNHIAYHLEGNLKSQKFYRYLTGAND
jgi:DNA repair protein RecO (recombination protein O)